MPTLWGRLPACGGLSGRPPLALAWWPQAMDHSHNSVLVNRLTTTAKHGRSLRPPETLVLRLCQVKISSPVRCFAYHLRPEARSRQMPPLTPSPFFAPAQIGFVIFAS